MSGTRFAFALAPKCAGCGAFHFADQPCPDGTRWLAARFACGVCGHAFAAVVPLRPGEAAASRTAQCPACGCGGASRA